MDTNYTHTSVVSMSTWSHSRQLQTGKALRCPNSDQYFNISLVWAQIGGRSSKGWLSTILIKSIYEAPGHHNSDVIMGALAFQIISLAIVYSTFYSGADQRKHQSSASRAFVRGIHRWPVNSSHKGPVTRKVFPFDDVITIIWTNTDFRAIWIKIYSWPFKCI